MYRDVFGLALESVHDLRADGISAAFLVGRRARIELLAPTVTDTGRRTLPRAARQGLHHVCFEVDGLAATLDALAEPASS